MHPPWTWRPRARIERDEALALFTDSPSAVIGQLKGQLSFRSRHGSHREEEQRLSVRCLPGVTYPRMVLYVFFLAEPKKNVVIHVSVSTRERPAVGSRPPALAAAWKLAQSRAVSGE